MKILLPFLCALVLVTSGLAEGRHTKGELPLVISQGREVDLKDFLVPGKITIFDFTSEYCGPCRAYADPLLHLHRQRPGIVVVKVDINRPEQHRIDWDSPVAKQYDMHSIPHFKVYGPDGKVLAEDKITFGPDGAPLNRDYAARQLVDRWIASLE